jgi:glycosyltransferase involved in cell wall biosynthesis
VPATPEPQYGGEPGIDGRCLYFGYLGRLVTEKGLPVLLRASRDLAAKGYSFRLRIVGDGPERPNLEKMAQEYGLAGRTEFVGSVPATAIKETLKGVSVIVMPSVCEDVAPLVAMEQMMDGRPLIGSDIGGLGLIASAAGLKFPAGDAAALEARMREVLENPSAVTEIGRRCREHALKTFSSDRMVRQHVEIYRQITQHKNSSEDSIN